MFRKDKTMKKMICRQSTQITCQIRIQRSSWFCHAKNNSDCLIELK